MSSTTTSANSIAATFGQGVVVTPDKGDNLQAIRTAAQGGDATAAYMHQQIPQSLFMQDIGLGTVAIIDSTLGYTDADGNWVDTGIPVTFSMSGSGANTLSVVTYVTVLQSIWEQMLHSDPAILNLAVDLRVRARPDIVVGRISDIIIADASRYDGLGRVSAADDDTSEPSTIGAVHNTFAYSQNPVWYGTMPILAATTALSLPLGKIAFPQFVKPALKSFWAGQKELWGSMSRAFDWGGTLTTLTNSAEQMGYEEVVEGTEEVALGFTAAGAACFGAILALAAIPVVVSKLAHYSYHVITVTNLSKRYDLVWSGPHIHNGSLNNAPVTSPGGDQYEELVMGARNKAPPHVKPVDVYQSAPFNFASTSSYAGLGDAFGFSLFTIDPSATTASDYASSTPVGYGGYAFDIPWSGDNSLACTFSRTPVDADAYWDSSDRVARTSFVATDDAMKVKLTVTFDYLQGTHPNNQGQNEYYYQSLVTLEDIT